MICFKCGSMMEHAVTTCNLLNPQQGTPVYSCHCCGQAVDALGNDMTAEHLVYWSDGKLHDWIAPVAHGPRRLVTIGMGR